MTLSIRTVVRTLAIGAGLAIGPAGCSGESEETIVNRIATLRAPAPLPPYGTDRPLDSARIAAVLARKDTGSPAVPTRRAGDPVAADAARLGWIWRIVGKAEETETGAWMDEASSIIAETAADYRNWPIRGARGPAVEAAMLDRVPESEIAALAAQRAGIATHLAAVHARDADPNPQTVRTTDPEALGWLLQVGGRTSLADTRFDSPSEAADYVRMLYANGARAVVIASEAILADASGLLYADALRVVLPGDRDQRAAIFDIVNGEAARDGYAPEPDAGQAVLYLWWD